MQREREPSSGRRTRRERGRPGRGRRARAAAALLLVALLLAVAAACSDDGLAPETLTLEAGGVPRQAIVVPGRSGDEPPPMVLVFHGLGSSGAQALESLPAFPERSGATVVLPDALPCGSAGAERCWPAEADAPGRGREEAFVARLVDAVAERWPVDPERVYAIGLSHGGAWVMRLLLDRPDVVHGGIIVSGYDPTRTYARTPEGRLALPLAPLTPSRLAPPETFRPVIIDHGTADAVVPYPLALELFRALSGLGWPGPTTLLHPLVAAGHLDPQLLLPDRLIRTLLFIEERAAAGAPAATAPAGGSG